MLIDRVGTPRRVRLSCLVWCGLLVASFLGLGERAGARDRAAPITTIAINLDQLVTEDRAEEAMCEPSAAVLAPWDPKIVLVGDNEVRGQLYAFALTGEGLEFAEALDIPKEGGARPRDIEALAPLEDAVLIVGSHSRNSRCERADDRERMALVSRASDGSLKADDFINSRPELEEAMEGADDCLETLFVSPAPPQSDVVCKALVDANAAADGAAPCACTALNIEGAVGLPDGRACSDTLISYRESCRSHQWSDLIELRS